jgi:hypothetical protein
MWMGIKVGQARKQCVPVARALPSVGPLSNPCVMSVWSTWLRQLRSFNN